MQSSVSLCKVAKTIAWTVFSCVLLGQSAPIGNSFAGLNAASVSTTKKTCIQHNSTAKPNWKKCVIKDPVNPHIPSYDELSIATDISNNKFYAMQVPKNEMKCHLVDRYDYASLPPPETDCPALCKLRDVVEKGTDCEHGLKDLFVQHVSKQKRIVVLKSPHYSCDTKYHRREICLYNVSMSCREEHVTVSKNPELTHMALDENDDEDGDFVQIVDYAHSRVYEKVSGKEWPKSQTNIYSSDFVVVFWSEPHWKPVGSRGFKLHMECGISTMDSSDDPRTEGSGSAEPDSPETPTVK